MFRYYPRPMLGHYLHASYDLLIISVWASSHEKSRVSIPLVLVIALLSRDAQDAWCRRVSLGTDHAARLWPDLGGASC